MAFRLTDEQRKTLEMDLANAEPYNEEEIELDGETDEARWKATMAKKFLKEAEDKEGTDHGQR